MVGQQVPSMCSLHPLSDLGQPGPITATAERLVLNTKAAWAIID